MEGTDNPEGRFVVSVHDHDACSDEELNPDQYIPDSSSTSGEDVTNQENQQALGAEESPQEPPQEPPQETPRQAPRQRRLKITSMEDVDPDFNPEYDQDETDTDTDVSSVDGDNAASQESQQVPQAPEHEPQETSQQAPDQRCLKKSLFDPEELDAEWDALLASGESATSQDPQQAPEQAPQQEADLAPQQGTNLALQMARAGLQQRQQETRQHELDLTAGVVQGLLQLAQRQAPQQPPQPPQQPLQQPQQQQAPPHPTQQPWPDLERQHAQTGCECEMPLWFTYICCATLLLAFLFGLSINAACRTGVACFFPVVVTLYLSKVADHLGRSHNGKVVWNTMAIMTGVTFGLLLQHGLGSHN